MAEIERLSGDLVNVSLGAIGSAENNRTPTIFKTGTNNVSFTVWTPTAGKRFRLLGYNIAVTANVSVAAAQQVNFSMQDGGVTQFLHSIFAPTAAVLTNPGIIPVASVLFPGNGYLSTAINNTFTCIFGTSFATGNLFINTFGTEE